MTSFASNYFKLKGMTGAVDLLNHDIRMALVGSTFNGTANAEFVGSIGTLGELSGTGYVRKVLASKTFTVDTGNNRAEFDCADVVWTGINAGTAIGYILYRHVTNDADSPFIGFVDTGGFPLTTNGGDLTVQVNAEGLIQCG
jgi:hypothetical protein